MTWEEREALIKEAALRLRRMLEAEGEAPLLPWRRRKWLENRKRAVVDYVFTVVSAYFVDAFQCGAPAEDESERVRAEAFERALKEVPHPEVAARAEELKPHLKDFWEVQYWRVRAEKGLAAPLPTLLGEGPEEAMPEWKKAWLRELEMWRQARAAEAEAAAVNQAEAGETDSPNTDTEAPTQGTAMSEAAPTSDSGPSEEVRRRLALLEEYKRATGATDNQIENDPRHTCRHPDFLRWKRGELPAQSKMARSLEKVLRSKKPPTARLSRKD